MPQQTINKIIRQRKALIRLRKSGKSEMLCYKVIKELEITMAAYGARWDDSKWKAFAVRNLEKILFLVPDNKAGESIKTKLINEIS